MGKHKGSYWHVKNANYFRYKGFQDKATSPHVKPWVAIHQCADYRDVRQAKWFDTQPEALAYALRNGDPILDKLEER